MPKRKYGAKWQNYQMIIAPETVQWLPNGSKVTIEPLKYAQFRFGVYETEDPMEQEFIEKHPDFQRGHVFSFEKMGTGVPSTTEAPAPAIKLPERILKRMTIDELLEYAEAARLILPMKPEEVRDGGMTKAALIQSLL